jgi:hypothetical protein
LHEDAAAQQRHHNGATEREQPLCGCAVRAYALD